MKRFLCILALWVTSPVLPADSPMPPETRVFTSDQGERVTFRMEPPIYDKDRKLVKEAYGVACRWTEDGKVDEVLYRTEGWYSFEVFVSRDGRYLVRMGPWNEGWEPAPGDLAVAFYKDGKLLKSYSTVDLVKDKSKVVASVSHYSWRGESSRGTGEKEYEKRRPRLDYENNAFRLTTIDGWSYVFDVPTGGIKSVKKLD